MKKYILFSLLSLSFLVTNVSALTIPTKDEFEEQRDYYTTFCSLPNLSEENEIICNEFATFLDNRTAELESEAQKLQGKIEEIAANIEEYVLKYQEYEKQIEQYESEIEILEEAMKVYSNDIIGLTNAISVRLTKIDMYKRLLNKTMFVLESVFDSPTDIPRLPGLHDINDPLKVNGLMLQSFLKEIEKLNVELDDLYKQRDELGGEFSVLAEQEAEVTKKKRTIQELQAANQLIFVEYKKQQAELEATYDMQVENIKETKEVLKSVVSAMNDVLSSDTWGQIIQGDHSISATAWAYPESFGGGVHLGTDFAAKVGTNIVAPANGVVLYSKAGCDNNGYLGNMCGKPGRPGAGNQMFILVKVRDDLYAISIYHMNGQDMLSTGTIFQQGALLGHVGNSGNTTGPHAHVEVHKLKEKNFADFVKNWDGDMSFGNGYGSAALSNICSKKEAPCRIAPQTIFK